MKSFTLQDAIRLGNRGEAEVESLYWPSAKRHVIVNLSEHVSSMSAKEQYTTFLQVGTLASSAKQLLQKYVSEWLTKLGFTVTCPSVTQVQIDWSQATVLPLPEKVTAGDWNWVGTWSHGQDQKDNQGEAIILDDKTSSVTLGFSARSVKTAQYLNRRGEHRLRFEMLHARCVDAIKQAIARGSPQCKFWVKSTINGKTVEAEPMYQELAAKLRINGFTVEQKDESMLLCISGWMTDQKQELNHQGKTTIPPPTSLFSAVAAAADYTLRKTEKLVKPDKTQPTRISRDDLLQQFVYLLFEYWKNTQEGREVPLDLWSRLKDSESAVLSRLT